MVPLGRSCLLLKDLEHLADPVSFPSPSSQKRRVQVRICIPLCAVAHFAVLPNASE